jgi:peptidoglycan/LPS O-acetylase OafA/YrhL
MSVSQEHQQVTLVEPRTTLSTTFNPKLNALNAIRLLLAVSVIIWHSYPLTGTTRPPPPVTQILGESGVDGFFAISGYLIVSSWARTPHWWPYLKARFLRILPAFWVCLIVTALILAPVGILIGGHGFPPHYLTDAAMYVIRNAALKINEYGIGGTPTDVPYPHAWNGSLWTLWWEFLCYLGVLALGLSRLLRFRATIPAVFTLCLVGVILTDIGAVNNFYIVNGSRFGLMFAAGALIYQMRHLLPARWPIVALAAGVVVGASMLEDYRTIGALPLAYLLITSGALLKVRALRFRNDLSYGTYIYAFPIQQILASAGLYKMGVPVFAAAAIPLVLAVAAGSWFGVEKPAMRLRNTKKAPARPGVTETKPGLHA